MAIGSLVLGIISLVTLFLPIGGWFGAIVGIIGIITGNIGRKDPEKKGMATAGLVCSIIGTILNLIFFIACIACAGLLGAAGAFDVFN